jgi:DNA-binding SARP family transcriptional activator
LNLAEVKRDQGEMDDALNLYNQALRTVSDSEPSLACTILCGISTLYRWQEQILEASAAAEEADRLARKHSIGNEGRVARLALWATRARSYDPAQALADIEQIAIEFEAQQERFALLQALGLCANAALLAGQPDAAEQHLDRASELARALGTSVPLAVEILHLPALEVFIRDRAHKYRSSVNALEQLRTLQVDQADEALIPADEPVPDIIYSLRIITLGQARVIRDGRAIPTTEWRPAARDLFLYLIFTKQATREQICLSFWPDSPAKRARDNFHTTMYRIREVLGENTVIVQDDLYQLNPDISIWCDAYELETLTAQARFLPFADARTEDLWRRAVGLYNGEFLPSLDFEWAVDYREHLHETYAEALVGLGRCVQARGEYREAVEIYKRALVVEPYREDIHQAIITCHVAKGAKHKALAQLNQLRKLLRKDLGIGPSNETLQLARTLLT